MFKCSAVRSCWETCDKINYKNKKTNSGSKSRRVCRYKKGELFHILDNLTVFSKNRKCKQTKENKRSKLHSSGIQLYAGTSYGKRAAHCKTLEWQVRNKKIHINSMEHVQKQHFSFNSRKRSSPFEPLLKIWRSWIGPMLWMDNDK